MKNMTNDTLFFNAISSLGSKGVWAYSGNVHKNFKDFYEHLEWLSQDIPKPTLEEIEAEMQRLQEEWDKTEYQRLRAPEYPSLTELADALYWNSKGDSSHLEKYYEKCEEVKNNYPKN